MIIRFFVFVVLLYLVYRIFKGIQQLKSGKDEGRKFKSQPTGEDLVEDPLCHTYVPVSQAYKKEVSGKDYYFCSKLCSDKYSLEKNN